MPLYLDIPAEMNVRKGYKEINVAGGYASFRDFKGQRALVEYDFAPTNRLGFEIEMPFVFVQEKHMITEKGLDDVIVPEEGGTPESANALRLGVNYALYSSPEYKTSVSVGFFNELEFTPFKHFGHPLFEGNVYNPFVAVAKVFGTRLHTMIYTGTATKHSFEHQKLATAVRFNTILAYRYGKGTRESFLGIESNQTWSGHEAGQMVLRPQIQAWITEKWKLGFVYSVPVATANQLQASGFCRVIYSVN
ncbi:hypothetical protein BLX24_09695 [Arsenicibacter rosenii]|uniref:Uncharacterized protein n=2 Tax=Arsenicibacter rosenii TaxID=1750698 RepID=A0A1S2VKJ0_9BACT|nr:hypothetical protein BLX24_09695 [Arsenicibacter rosenii]